MNKLYNKKIIKKIWNSPTINTWASYSTKALSLFGILPLILKHFPSNDIILWYLFSTVISLQGVADFGFRQTFSRLISFTYNGAEDINNCSLKNTSEMLPNVSLMKSIFSSMKIIYKWLTLAMLMSMGTIGTLLLEKPINDSSNSVESWISWIALLMISSGSFYGKIYLNYLEGLNKITLTKRVDTLTSLGSIITGIIILLISPKLLYIVLSNQIWVLLSTYKDWYLSKKVNLELYNQISKDVPFDKEILKKIWQPAWRSGISGVMSTGITNLTGIVYAHIGNQESVAAYLLALRMINQIKEISMAPFYSKIPTITMLRVKNDIPFLIKTIKRGMFFSHMVFIAGFVFVGILSDVLLKSINPEIVFVDQKMWILLGAAFFFHRYGAMHLQVYMSTNHIISHIADSVSGIIYLIMTCILIKYIGVYAIPCSMLIGYLGFYSWYAASYAYKSIYVTFWDFEKTVVLIPLTIGVLYAIIAIGPK